VNSPKVGGGLSEAAVALPAMKEVDEVRNLPDLLFRKSADLLEEVLFLERITHSHIILPVVH
jgi:hypothetical protein